MKTIEKICVMAILGMLVGVSLVPLFSGEWNHDTPHENEVQNSVFQKDGEPKYMNPDTEIVPFMNDPDYQFAVTRTPLKSFFTEKLTDGSGIKVTTTSSDGEEVSLVYEPTTMALREGAGHVVSQVGLQESQGVFLGNTATYRELYPAVDFEFIVQAGKLKHNIILNQPPVISEGLAAEELFLEFTGMLWFSDDILLFVDGKKVTEDFSTQEAIELRDSSGRVLFTIPTPLTQDSNQPAKGMRSEYDVTFMDGGVGISVATPLDWLLTAKYPVMVDPTVMGAEFIIDAKVDRDHRIVDATWHAGTGQFLVVWSELPDPAGSDEIRGQLVNLDSTLAGGDFLISEAGGSKDFPQVAHIGDTVKPEQQLSFVRLDGYPGRRQ